MFNIFPKDKPSAYINRDDLIQVLSDFFQGTLGEPKDISRVNMDLEDWIPGNSLWGQCTPEMISQVILSLPKSQRLSLAVVLGFNHPKYEVWSTKLKSIFFNSESQSSFEDWISQNFIEALDTTSNKILSFI